MASANNNNNSSCLELITFTTNEALIWLNILSYSRINKLFSQHTPCADIRAVRINTNNWEGRHWTLWRIAYRICATAPGIKAATQFKTVVYISRMDYVWTSLINLFWCIVCKFVWIFCATQEEGVAVAGQRKYQFHACIVLKANKLILSLIRNLCISTKVGGRNRVHKVKLKYDTYMCILITHKCTYQ